MAKVEMRIKSGVYIAQWTFSPETLGHRIFIVSLGESLAYYITHQ